MPRAQRSVAEGIADAPLRADAADAELPRRGGRRPVRRARGPSRGRTAAHPHRAGQARAGALRDGGHAPAAAVLHALLRHAVRAAEARPAGGALDALGRDGGLGADLVQRGPAALDPATAARDRSRVGVQHRRARSRAPVVRQPRHRASWDEIWLNEAFATWMANKASDHFNPTWQMRLNGRVPIDRTMARDADRATRAIRSGPVRETRRVRCLRLDHLREGRRRARECSSSGSAPEAFRAGSRPTCTSGGSRTRPPATCGFTSAAPLAETSPRWRRAGPTSPASRW